MGELSFDAVILAGGKGSRLGGVDKAELKVGGVRLLDRVLAAADGARTRVVVGPVAAPEGVIVTREDPPGTGPAAGLVAGLLAIAEPAEWTLVLACDLPGAAGAAPRLLEAAVAAGPDENAIALTNGQSGDPEWLFAIYRTEALRAAARDYGEAGGRSVRGLVRPLGIRTVAAASMLDVHDLDTWADHARWNAHLRSTDRRDEDRSAWRPFIERVCAAVGIDPAEVDESAILDMTREVAHAGARPMAPVSAFILGLAVGRGGDPDYLLRVVEDAATAAPVPSSTGNSADDAEAEDSEPDHTEPDHTEPDHTDKEH
ncbi:NTP transferase domain-containing protein [Propionibacteriaceae bacterium G1746]|uniref:NTP transferase domain-containing protein n=1 Tax=Aestuariimicrobium sp. G57 TaxID=3418485 RepID=UPI003C18D8AB